MDAVQALAIAAAAFVASLAFEREPYPRHFSEQAEAAVQRALVRAEIQPLIDADFAFGEAVNWHACERAPKGARL